MADHGNSIKDDDKYEALRDEGMSKERAAKIANSGKEGSKRGGEHSHGGSSSGGKDQQKVEAGRKGGKASH